MKKLFLLLVIILAVSCEKETIKPDPVIEEPVYTLEELEAHLVGKWQQVFMVGGSEQFTYTSGRITYSLATIYWPDKTSTHIYVLNGDTIDNNNTSYRWEIDPDNLTFWHPQHSNTIGTVAYEFDGDYLIFNPDTGGQPIYKRVDGTN